VIKLQKLLETSGTLFREISTIPEILEISGSSDYFTSFLVMTLLLVKMLLVVMPSLTLMTSSSLVS
jgi:hypothetical protein